MIRILFGLVVVLVFVSCWVFLMYAMRGGDKHWFWSGGRYHFIALAISTIITVVIVLGLAQPMAFLKFIFG